MKVHEIGKMKKTVKLHTLKSGDTFRLAENGPIHMVCSVKNTNWVEAAVDRVVCVALESGDISAPVEGVNVFPVNVEAKVVKD